MNIINRVALRTMKLNRVRTIVTIIGIILSTAMFTAVFTICTSLFNFVKEAEIEDSGSYHLHAMQVTGSDVKNAMSDARTNYAACTSVLGYAAFGSVNPDKPYICVLAVDGTFTSNMPIHLTSGRMPENENELLLPDHLASNGGASYAVGDTLTLGIGARTTAAEDGEEAFPLYQQNAYSYEAETLSDVSEKTYTVVGTCARPDFEPYFAPGYTALTVLNGVEDSSVYDCYLRVNDPRKNYFAFVKDHPELTQNGAEEHDGLLGLEGASRYDNLSRVLVSFAVILSLLVFVGSVALIYSAFSISVSERTKQFGLLSSIGATKKQVRRSVLTEALTLSAVGIPLGVLAGIGGIALTLFLLRDKFQSFLPSAGVTMRVYVTWPVIAAAAAVALLTVLVSAWIPSVRAMRVSPIEAIRQTRDVKAGGNKSARYPKLFAKLFGVEGLLAKKYFVRSSKKYRATIISLAMSVILFVAASGFCLYITRSANSIDNRPNFDGLYSNLPADEFARLRSALAEHATEFAGYMAPGSEDTLYASIPEADSTPEYKAYIEKRSANYSEVGYNCYAQKTYMDDAAFRELLEKNGLSDEGWFDPEHPKAIVVNSASVPVYERQDNGNYTRVNYVFDFLKKGVKTLSVAADPERPEGYVSFGTYWTGSAQGEGTPVVYFVPADAEYDEIEYDDHGRPVGQLEIPLEFYDIEIGALIEEAPVGSWEASAVNLIYPMSVYRGSAETVSFCFRSNDTAKSIEEMTAIMQDAGVAVGSDRFYDADEDGRLMNNIVTIIKVFSYGFIALISLISVANVFNTVTTNVALRRRDYAMLRSMGMTSKGMNRMSNFECLIYGSRSLLIGLPVAIGLTYLVYRVATDAANMKFTLPWTAIAIAVVSVFLVVFLSMLYSTHKLKKDNPIDALKDENI